MPRENAGAITWLEALSGVLGTGILLSGLAAFAVTCYYLFGTFTASDSLFRGTVDGKPLAAADFQHLISTMQLLCNVLLVASFVAAVCAVGRYYGSPETGVALVLVGAALLFGVPFLFDSFGGPVTKLPAALLKLQLPDPRSFLKSQYVMAGMAVAGTGGLQLLVHAFLFVVQQKDRRPKANAEAAKTAQQVRKANDRFLGPCWTLPFCRDTEKKLCPIRHSKKPCWRSGRGCYCDQNVILTLSGGNQYAASRGSAGYLSATATIARPRTYSEKRAQCLQCPVYLHRQGQKYKLAAPGSILAVVGVVYFFWDSISQAWPHLMEAAGRGVKDLNFAGTHSGSTGGWTTEAGNNPILRWLLIVVGISLVVSYLLHAVEWALYRMGI